MNFNVGDIIFNKKDKITFTIVEKSKGNRFFTLEYYDTHMMKVMSIIIKKWKLEEEFKQRPKDLEHFKVILK
jgi:methanogenic corrinoid protein MtbC1